MPDGWRITGHSLGGGLAAAAALASRVDTLTFNAAGVNLATMQRYAPWLFLTSDAQMKQMALNIIDSFVVDRDILNGLQDHATWAWQYFVASHPTIPGLPPFSSWPQSMPPSLGCRIELQSNLPLWKPWTPLTAHSYFVESLLIKYNLPLK